MVACFGPVPTLLHVCQERTSFTHNDNTSLRPSRVELLGEKTIRSRSFATFLDVCRPLEFLRFHRRKHFLLFCKALFLHGLSSHSGSGVFTAASGSSILASLHRLCSTAVHPQTHLLSLVLHLSKVAAWCFWVTCALKLLRWPANCQPKLWASTL